MSDAMENIPVSAPQAKRKRLGMIVLIPLIASLIVLGVFAMQWREGLKIQRVVVDGARTLTANEIFALAGSPSKAGMYSVDLHDIQRRIGRHPFIKDVCVTRQYPKMLRIDIEEREPVASFNAGQLLYLDAEGVVLPGVAGPRKFDLPLISGIAGLERAEVGKRLENAEVFEALSVVRAAQDLDTAMYHLISEVNMGNGNDMVLYSSDVGVPIILGRGEVGRKLVTLETFWKNFVGTSDVEKIKYIDLRYDEQVVVRWNQQAEARSRKISL